jgi:hypothetical protein
MLFLSKSVLIPVKTEHVSEHTVCDIKLKFQFKQSSNAYIFLHSSLLYIFVYSLMWPEACSYECALTNKYFCLAAVC